MKFKGNIIITDPCYFATDEDWGEKISYDDKTIDSSLGFSNYLMEDTGIGDGRWRAYKIKGNIKLHSLTQMLKDIYQDEDFEYKIKGSFLGEFCADAGMSCVVYLDEVLKYNPEFKSDLPRLIDCGCVCAINDFDGDITTFFDESSSLHFIGIGDNFSFYTV